MRKTQNTTSKLNILITGLLLVIVFVLTGCNSNAAPMLESEPDLTEAALIVDDVALENGTEEAIVETAVTPEEPVDECLACHIDKEMLIATAEPEEEIISENEGEG